MQKYGVKKFVFSSSATVYGEPERIPLTEDCKTGGTTNPYGTSKLFIEQILKDIFGNDYDTPDGTGVRDYIHVVDLAKGHLAALNKLDKEGKGLYIYNLGTGTGYSVLDMVKSFEEITGKKVPYKITQRRPGDIATCYSDTKKAKEELGWEAKKGIKEMCEDSWNFIQKNK